MVIIMISHYAATRGDQQLGAKQVPALKIKG